MTSHDIRENIWILWECPSASWDSTKFHPERLSDYHIPWSPPILYGQLVALCQPLRQETQCALGSSKNQKGCLKYLKCSLVLSTGQRRHAANSFRNSGRNFLSPPLSLIDLGTSTSFATSCETCTNKCGNHSVMFLQSSKPPGGTFMVLTQAPPMSEKIWPYLPRIN